MDQIRQADQRLTVGQEVIYQQHPVLRPQIIAADHNGIIGAMGKGVNHGAVHRAVHIAGPVFFCKHHRHSQLHCHSGSNGDAGGLNGEDLVHAAVFIKRSNLLGHIRQKGGINLLIQKGAHLENAAGKHLSFFQNHFFHRFHMGILL